MQHSTSDVKLHCSQHNSTNSSEQLSKKLRLHASSETMNFIRFFAHTYQPTACV